MKTLHFTRHTKAILPASLLALLTACGGNSNNLNEISEQAERNSAEKKVTMIAAEGDSSPAGSLYVPDNELTVSEIYGADLVFSGYTEKYVVEVEDADGVSAVKFTLKDRAGNLIQDMPSISKSIGYVGTLTSDDLRPGGYTIEVSATGIDGGDGDKSSEQIVSFNIDVKGEATKSVSERF